MKIREKRRLTQNKGVSVKIRETWQVCIYLEIFDQFDLFVTPSINK